MVRIVGLRFGSNAPLGRRSSRRVVVANPEGTPGLITPAVGRPCGSHAVEVVAIVAPPELFVVFVSRRCGAYSFVSTSVALQSAMYGIAILASDISGFRALESEGLRLSFFKWRDTESLKQAIEQILDSPDDTRRQDALRNLEYCHRQRMEEVVDECLNILEWLVAKPGRKSG